MIFKKKKSDLFTQLPIETADFLVVSWNHGGLKPGERTFLIDLQGLEKISIRYSSLYERIEILSQKEKQVLKMDSQNRDLLNLTLHGTLVQAIEKGKRWSINESNTKELAQIAQEDRAREWIKTSFRVLTQALEKVAQDQSLILQATLMSGIFPENGQRLIRLHVFNLDIYYHFLTDESLRVIIFDQNDQKLDARIWVTKPQIYDELIKVIVLLGKVGELKEC